MIPIRHHAENTHIMQPTCQLIRRPLPKKSPWRKWVTTTAEIIGAVVTIALLVTLTILCLAL